MKVIDYIQQGGPIMYILLFLNIIGFTIMFAKFYLLSREKKNLLFLSEKFHKKITQQIESTDPNVLIEYTRQEINTYMGKMEHGLNTIKIIASVSPLLGLLGTVIGVLIAFQVISQTGLSDPSAFARGISMALVTTVGGLIVAIPHYVGHNYLLGILDKIETNLEKHLLGKIL